MSRIIDKGGNIGEWNGVDNCPAWLIHKNGKRYDFNRSRNENPILSADEILMDTDLIYKEAKAGKPAPCCAGECEICMFDDV